MPRYTPLPQDQIHQTCQVLLTYLVDERNSTPNNMVDGIASAKSLLRGILTGHLTVCSTPQKEDAGSPPAPAAAPEVTTEEKDSP